MDVAVVAALLGSASIGVGIYMLGDPIGRAGNFVSPNEWLRDEEVAREKQRKKATIAAAILLVWGVFFLVIAASALLAAI